MMDIQGVSYIGRPRPNTAMYVTAKVGHLCENLRGVANCLVFAEAGTVVPEDILSNHEFHFSSNPLLEYVSYAIGLEEDRDKNERSIPYNRTDLGALISATAMVGDGAYIEPGVIIGPGVVIGNDATILSGAVIRHAVIGNRVVVNEHAVIGAQGFTMARDESNDLIRIPTLGRVVIEDDVEIGAHDNVSCGSGGDTVIHDHAKIDALVYIGHDATIGRNVEIPAGVVVGGFCEIGDDAFVGVGAVLRNRITVGDDSVVGMGAVVTKSVEPGITVVGNPAKPFDRRK